MKTSISGRKQVTSKQVNTLGKFKSFIASMVPGVIYDMPKNFPYRWFEIDFDLLSTNNKDRQVPYSYSAERNYGALGSTGYVFPLKGNYVKHWAKEESAKAALLKDLGWMYTKNGSIQAKYN